MQVKDKLKRVDNWSIERLKDRSPRFYFLIGLLFTTGCYSFFPIFTVIGDALCWILATFLYNLGLFFGMSEEKSWKLIDVIYNDAVFIENPYAFTDFATYISDYIAAIILWVGETGRKTYLIVIDYFPVLLDLKLDLDFINIDFVKILRSVFSVLQFIIIFIIARKIRIYLRKVIKKRINDNDYFDKQFFKEVAA